MFVTFTKEQEKYFASALISNGTIECPTDLEEQFIKNIDYPAHIKIMLSGLYIDDLIKLYDFMDSICVSLGTL